MSSFLKHIYLKSIQISPKSLLVKLTNEKKMKNVIKLKINHAISIYVIYIYNFH